MRLVLQNTGWLPTNVTEKAVERKAVRPLEVELTLPEGATLVAGERKDEVGQLDGRVHKRSTLWWGGDDSTGDLAKLEWVIEAPEGGELGIEARHQRAGTVRQVVPLAKRRVYSGHEPDERSDRRGLAAIQGALAPPADVLVRRLPGRRGDRCSS